MMLISLTNGDCCLLWILLRTSWSGSGPGDTLTALPSLCVSEPESPSPLSPLSALAPSIPFNSDYGAQQPTPTLTQQNHPAPEKNKLVN